MPQISLRALVGAGSALLPAVVALAVLLAQALQSPGVPALAGTAIACGVVALGCSVMLRRALLRRLDHLLTAQAVESQRFELAINKISQGLCFFDGQQRLIVCNRRYAELYQLTPDMVRPGTTLREIVDHRWVAGSCPDMTREEYLAWRVSISIIAKASDTVLTLMNGRVVAIHHQPMPDGGWVATHEDITERRRVQAQVEHMARCDALTGLPNRVQFRERLSKLQAAGGDASAAVLLVDLDRFKAVNDTLGHPVGDLLLVPSRSAWAPACAPATWSPASAATSSPWSRPMPASPPPPARSPSAWCASFQRRSTSRTTRCWSAPASALR